MVATCPSSIAISLSLAGFVRRAEFGQEDPISTGLALFAVVLLVLANGFFVATEFALVSVRRTRMQQLAAEGNRRAQVVLDRLSHLDTYIAATQLGITISSLGLGWIGEPAIARLIEPAVEWIPFLTIEPGSVLSHTIAFIIAFSFITAMHIVLGELAPKSLALQRPDSTSLAVAPWIHIFLLVFRPIIVTLNRVGNWVVRLAGIEPAPGHALVQSAEELKLSIDASREAGLVHQTAHDLVDRAFTFTGLQARHVMVPRTEVTAVPTDATLDDILRIASASSHVRLPVYEGDSDHIVGIINIKRLLPLFSPAVNGGQATTGDRLAASTFDARDYMVEPLAIPETLPASDVLSRLQEGRAQLAIVIDEYGGTAGIVTLEDLVESLIGEIEDEVEADEYGLAVWENGTVLLDGLTSLVEARERHGIDLREEELDVETVGGYVFSTLGRPAVLGDEVTAPSGQLLRVEELDGLRVARVRVLPTTASADHAGISTPAGNGREQERSSREGEVA